MVTRQTTEYFWMAVKVLAFILVARLAISTAEAGQLISWIVN